MLNPIGVDSSRAMPILLSQVNINSTRPHRGGDGRVGADVLGGAGRVAVVMVGTRGRGGRGLGCTQELQQEHEPERGDHRVQGSLSLVTYSIIVQDFKKIDLPW
eukprot:SAG22_NODE_3426_length_1719_cov_1.109877_1_plen_104_part_00